MTVTGRNGREIGESCGAHLHADDASTLAERSNDPELSEGLSAAVQKLPMNDQAEKEGLSQGSYKGWTDEQKGLPHFLFQAKLLELKESAQRMLCTEDCWNRCSVYAQPCKNVVDTMEGKKCRRRAWKARGESETQKQKCVPE